MAEHSTLLWIRADERKKVLDQAAEQIKALEPHARYFEPVERTDVLAVLAEMRGDDFADPRFGVCGCGEAMDQHGCPHGH